MTIRLSSGLRDAVITNYGMGRTLQFGHIRLYAGPQPASADSAATGTLVGVVTTGGLPAQTGESPASGLRFSLGRNAGELASYGAWTVRAMNAEKPGWWRFVGRVADDGAASATLARLDGLVVGDGLVIDLAAWADGATIPVTGFLMTLPSEQ